MDEDKDLKAKISKLPKAHRLYRLIHNTEEPIMMNFTGLVDAELAKARSAHGDIQSIHEGLAVIMEEFEEFKAEVFRRDVNEANLKKELVQVATMCRRFYEDLFSNK